MWIVRTLVLLSSFLHIFYPVYKSPQNPLQICISPGLISRILWYGKLLHKFQCEIRSKNKVGNFIFELFWLWQNASLAVLCCQCTTCTLEIWLQGMLKIVSVFCSICNHIHWLCVMIVYTGFNCHWYNQSFSGWKSRSCSLWWCSRCHWPSWHWWIHSGTAAFVSFEYYNTRTEEWRWLCGKNISGKGCITSLCSA